jgi:predicted outer membrane protein
LAQQLAPQIGVNLRGLNSTEQNIVERFSSLSGDAFDRAFLAYLIQSHQQGIGRFQVAAVRASRQNVRNFAATNLPMLMQHLLDLLQVRETFFNSP